MDKPMGVTGKNIFGTHDQKTLVQLADVASRAERVALLSDGHLGYIMPIGGVAAYDNKISVAGVGFDIACGNAAIRTNKTLADVEGSLPQLANKIADNISFGIGRKNVSKDAPDDHKLFESEAWEVIPSKGGMRERLSHKARNQLGTVGSGNHYVDIFADEHNRIWVGVHFGSRGLGHTIATAFMSLYQGGTWEDKAKETEALLSLNDELGKDYWALMNLAGEYAYVGREWVARKVVELLGAEEKELVHNHHNFAWKETHDGKEYVVVRKGATPAFPGQKGFVGGSMGDNAVILQGAVNADAETKVLQEAALYSTFTAQAA